MRVSSSQLLPHGVARLVFSLLCAFLCFHGLGCATSPFVSLNELRRLYDLPPQPTSASYPNADGIVLFSTQRTEIYQKGTELHTERNLHRIVKVFRNADAFRRIVIAGRNDETLAWVEARYINPSGATKDLDGKSFRVEPLESILAKARESGRELPMVSPGFAAAYLEGALQDAESILDRQGYLTLLRRLDSDTHHSQATGPTTIASAGSFAEISVPEVEPGGIIEYRCAFRRPSADLFDQWYVQDYLPIQYSEYRLSVPQGLQDAEGIFWDWRFRLYRCARIGDPQVRSEENPEFERMQTYRWVARDVPAFDAQVFMPAHEEEIEFGRLTRSSWEDWTPLADWYRTARLSTALAPRARVTAAAESIVVNTRGELERVNRLRHFVQGLPTWNRPLDAGNLVPASSEEVLTRPGGDSKDKSVLLVNLLRAAGITADPALVVTKNRGGEDARFPMWNFDRMVVRAVVDGNPVWIDSASQGRPLGKMPWFCEGRSALVLPQAGPGRFETIPESSLLENRTHEAIRIDVGAEDAAIDIEISASGEAAAQWREFVLAVESVSSAASEVARLVTAGFPDAQVTSFDTGGLTSEDDFSLRVSFRTRLAIVDGVPWPSLHALPLDGDFGLGLLALASRRYPIEIGHRWTVVRSIDIDLTGSSYEAEVVPGGASFESADVRFLSEYAMTGSRHVRGSQKWEIRSSLVKTRNYDVVAKIGLALDATRGAGFGFRRVP